MMLDLTDSAVAKLRELVLEEDNPNLMLRVFVQGGGCSGFQYGFTFDETVNEGDFDFNYDTVKVVVDSMSMEYLQGSKIDFQDDLNGTSFVINNPTASSTCGCGSSFSV
jgi:iron-sulfur cluster insertion protein